MAEAQEREWWHGSITGYSHHHCDCAECLAAWAEHQRRYVASHPEQQEKSRERARASYWRRKAKEKGMATDKTYLIERTEQEEVTCTVRTAGGSYPLRHVNVHSPDGFNYAYGGSGPADLALSIAADLLGEDAEWVAHDQSESRAWAVHQSLKWSFVATLAGNVRQHVLDGNRLLLFIAAYFEAQQKEEAAKAAALEESL